MAGNLGRPEDRLKVTCASPQHQPQPDSLRRRLLILSLLWAIAAMMLTAARVASVQRSDRVLAKDYSQFPTTAKERRMDAKQLSRIVTTIDKTSESVAGTNREQKIGNLTRFTEVRNMFFDATSDLGGATMVLNFTKDAISDIFFLNGTQKLLPYATGDEHASRRSVDRKHLVFNGIQGYIYKGRSHSKFKVYNVTYPGSLNQYRHRNFARPPLSCLKAAAASPAPWLLQFSNVLMSPKGEVYVPVQGPAIRRGEKEEWDVIAYQYQGGCCGGDMTSVVGERVIFKASDLDSRNPTEVGFSVAQNHGSTYFHVTNEVIPRLLTFWEVAMAVISIQGGKIVGPGYPTVFPNMLRSFGVPYSKMELFGNPSGRPRFFKKLYVPAPFNLDAYQHDCVRQAVGRVIGTHKNGGRSGKVESALPLVVLLERAQSRSDDGTRCQGRRCMANFAELRDALLREFRGRIELQILSGKDPNVMDRGVALFARATVVVGMHGAGFSNIMFMRGRGTYCIHLGWGGMWQLYGRIAEKFNVGFVNILTEGASQNGENARAEIPVVIHEVRQSLLRENFALDPPRIETNASRNAVVTMRMDDPSTKRKFVRAIANGSSKPFASDWKKAANEYLPHLETEQKAAATRNFSWVFPTMCRKPLKINLRSRIDTLLDANGNMTFLEAFSELLEGYVAWHARVSSHSRREECVQLLEWTCGADAGLGDRMRGVLHAAMVAVETRRFLIVRPPAGFPLGTFLAPNRIKWDVRVLTGRRQRPAFVDAWGVRALDLRAISSVHGRGGFDEAHAGHPYVVLKSRAFPHYERLVGTRWMRTNCRRKPGARCGYNGVTNVAVLRLLHRALFRVNARAAAGASAVARTRRLRSYFAVHARIGGRLDPIRGRFARFNADRERTARRLVGCVERGRRGLGLPKMPLYVASDDQAFKAVLGRHARALGYRVELSPIRPRHSKIVGRRPRSADAERTLADVVTDTLLLGGARLLVTTGSGMSTYAAITGNATLLHSTRCGH